MKSLLYAALFAVVPSAALAADYVLAIEDKGMREYYCTINVSLTNTTDQPLMEISGFFYSYVDDTQVGRSKGTWFMNVPAGEAATAVFETPNAPCDDVTRYDFIVGACRIDGGFEDVAVCRERLSGTGSIVIATAEG